MFAKLNILSPVIFLAALSLHAETPSCRPINSFEQGYALRQNQMMAAYNAPARIDVRGSWDFYSTGSYIYWQPIEDNLESGVLYTGTPTAAKGRVADLEFQYSSGFKKGLGVFGCHDNWDLYAEYTWLRSHAYQHIKVLPSQQFVSFWGPSIGAFTSAKSRWDVSFEIIDAQLARSYYVGSRLTFRPFFAGRAAWINQRHSAFSYVTPKLFGYMHNHTHSWGVGPEVGITAHWLLGYGVRVLGTAEADVLYTRYNLRLIQAASNELPISWSERHAYRLRPHTNLDLGFGWGTYIDNHNYHFDILGTYGFQVFWSQNMFRKSISNTALVNGDLYVQGVTGTVRFDF